MTILQLSDASGDQQNGRFDSIQPEMTSDHCRERNQLQSGNAIAFRLHSMTKGGGRRVNAINGASFL
tara:strand:+ start:3777 stop:3977 length:201 start_codon:yes stop_codon:yes gene_type:complete